ncbi:hypothetical protein GCK72_011751 [Caenorhabditis remanei]|uniref:Uncharacterized protein n=1 Tax=Caenorhabditis remanei TaxID=31234 RepID=A0A6A5H8K9_CAERE|nr:hypothetical protein GCK72_011751 [Caenorhabditis remanei]KAF1763485.1 hypothetical protein GCK72_011751 [Caenorhabditis remanei]
MNRTLLMELSIEQVKARLEELKRQEATMIEELLEVATEIQVLARDKDPRVQEARRRQRRIERDISRKLREMNALGDRLEDEE